MDLYLCGWMTFLVFLFLYIFFRKFLFFHFVYLSFSPISMYLFISSLYSFQFCYILLFIISYFHFTPSSILTFLFSYFDLFIQAGGCLGSAVSLSVSEGEERNLKGRFCLFWGGSESFYEASEKAMEE